MDKGNWTITRPCGVLQGPLFVFPSPERIMSRTLVCARGGGLILLVGVEAFTWQ